MDGIYQVGQCGHGGIRRQPLGVPGIAILEGPAQLNFLSNFYYSSPVFARRKTRPSCDYSQGIAVGRACYYGPVILIRRVERLIPLRKGGWEGLNHLL